MSRISKLAADANDIREKPVPVPEWSTDDSPVTILVRGLDGYKRADFMERLAQGREGDSNYSFASLEPELLVLCCLDPEDNSQCFTPDDIPMLLSKSGAVLNRLSTAAMNVSGLSKEAEAKLGKDSSVSAETPSASSTLS